MQRRQVDAQLDAELNDSDQLNTPVLTTPVAPSFPHSGTVRSNASPRIASQPAYDSQVSQTLSMMADLMKQQQVQANEREANLTRVIQKSQDAQKELWDRVERSEERRLKAMGEQERKRMEEQKRLEERARERKRKEEVASIPSLPPMKHNTDLDDYTELFEANQERRGIPKEIWAVNYLSNLNDKYREVAMKLTGADRDNYGKLKDTARECSPRELPKTFRQYTPAKDASDQGIAGKIERSHKDGSKSKQISKGSDRGGEIFDSTHSREGRVCQKTDT